MDCTKELKYMPIQQLTTIANAYSTIGLSLELGSGETKRGVHYQ